MCPKTSLENPGAEPPAPAGPAESVLRTRLQERYDRLWSEAVARIRNGNLELDPVLAGGLPDARRGLTVIARPSPPLRRNVMAFLEELRALEPAQHYYRPSELHLTVLGLFTATVEAGPFLARTREFTDAVRAALSGVAPFTVEFSGVTASPAAVLIQGFFADAALNDLRDSLRRQLDARGLAASVDGRYRLETAHLTGVRFRAPLRDGARFAAALEGARTRTFGAVQLRSVSLVQNDWYMTHRTLKTVARFPLRGPARA